MVKVVKQWLASLRWPKDPNFKQRPQASEKFGKWVLVEIGANDYAVLVGLLSKIRLSNAEPDMQGHQIIGLRYMALAMSARTKSGRIPLDWNNQSDLLWLGTLPYSRIEPALEAIAVLSDIPWIAPSFIAAEHEQTQEAELDVIPPTAEEIEENPS